MVDISSGNLSIDGSGRLVVSGLGTGINSQQAVDNIVKAKRQPAVSLETRISDNKARTTALKELRTSLNALQNAITNMRGAVTFGNTGNVFAAKQTFATTSRTDGLTPSSANNLIGVSVSNSAAVGSQTLEVRRLATAHKVVSGTFASTSSALGISGGIDISNGTTTTTVTIQATDSLADVRDRINNANTGTNATKVTASIVSVSPTQNVLILSNDTLGTNLNVTDSGTALSGLGLSSDHGTTFTNTLQQAGTARMTANGLTNPKHFESVRVSSGTAQLGSLASSATFPGSFTINGTGSATINYTSTMTLSGLAAAINLETGTTGVTATVVADQDGVRLDLDSASNFTMTDTSGLLSGLEVNNLQIIERNTNTVSDLFTGVTVSLFGAESGTTIKIDIDRDLNSAKSDIQAFVDAYNSVRHLINEHSLRDESGQKSSEAGELFGMPVISDLRRAISTIVGGQTLGLSTAVSTLTAIGVNFVDNNAVTDELDKETLEIDATKLDEALINNPDAVRRLFAFDLTSSNPNVVLLGFNGKTTFSQTGYTLNVGTLGTLHQKSTGFTDGSALLNAATSFAATTSGSFTVNGATVTYDVTTDTVETLVAKINNATTTAANGVTARVVAGPSNTQVVVFDSSGNAVAVANDTGDLLAAMGVTPDTDKLDFANIGGAAGGASNGTATVSGRTIEVTDASGASGLRLFYRGTGSESSISLNFTVGIAARLSDVIDRFSDTTNGAIEAELDSISGQDEAAQLRIDAIDSRLAILRASLTERFVAMETAVTSMRRILESLKSQFAALTGSSS